jgi:AraC-like DNA-binding protein
MALITFVPQPPLAAFVELFWHCDGYAQGHAWERVLPTGNVQLVVRLRDDPLRTYEPHDSKQPQACRGPLICGPHSNYFAIDTTPLALCMGVLFKPGGAYPFLGAPASEFHNLTVPLDTLWGPAAHELRDRLLEARTPNARFRILERSLLSQTQTPLKRHPAVAFALQEFQAVPHDRTIAEVARQTGLSSKWFIESFRAQVGLSPKMYCRLRRFQTALTRMGRRQELDWADLALECGYYDQAHFIRDFREFADVCPTKYLADRTFQLDHVRLADLLHFCPIFGVRFMGESEPVRNS